MGCTSSVYAIIIRKKKRKIIPEVSVFVPFLRVPAAQNDMHRALRGLIPKDLAERITSLRNQIAFIAHNTDGLAINELIKALEEYLSLAIGLTKKEYGLQDSVEFIWKDLGNGKQEMSVANSWFEVISVLHMMAMLKLMEANLKLIPVDNTSSGMSERIVSPDCMRDAVDLLLKASGYLNVCVQHAIPTDAKGKLPSDMQGSFLEAISHQALGQGTEIQLGLAVQSQNATLPVKRRLACEQLTFFTQAYFCLSDTDNNGAAAARKKQLLYLKWKHLEAKAAAYYYHGLMVDKGSDPSSHVSAVWCFFAAEELLTESKKASLSFCLAPPITRTSPPWGAMKHLHKKIPETATKKSEMYRYLLEQEKGLRILPDLPEFELSLKPEEYELPEADPAWDFGEWEIPGQTLKEQLDEPET